MLAIIYAGLAILPLGLLVFGSLFLKARFKNLNMAVVLSAGLIVMFAEFIIFNSRYAQTIDAKLWNSLGAVISYFPVITSFSVIAVCGFIFVGTELFKFKNNSSEIKMYAVISLILLVLRFALEPQPGLDFKVINQLTQADCDEVQLRTYADHAQIDYQIAIVANKNVPADLILKLSQSDNEMVRFYSTFNPQLSTERLTQMKTSDVSKEVRKQAQNELQFSRGIKN